MKEIAMPWHTTDRVVCTDSYFASVPAAEELWKRGLRFICVINTATRQFPMAYLSNIYFHNWVDMSGLLINPVESTKPVLGGFFWMDRNRRYFIFTGGLMEKGRTYTRTRWRQEDPAPNADPNMVDLTIPQTTTAELYYIACGQIDRHNRCRQESLDIEKKLGTKYWSKRFNLSVFAMNVVYFWLDYQGITGMAETQAGFSNYLAE